MEPNFDSLRFSFSQGKQKFLFAIKEGQIHLELKRSNMGQTAAVTKCCLSFHISTIVKGALFVGLFL